MCDACHTLLCELLKCMQLCKPHAGCQITIDTSAASCPKPRCTLEVEPCVYYCCCYPNGPHVRDMSLLIMSACYNMQMVGHCSMGELRGVQVPMGGVHCATRGGVLTCIHRPITPTAVAASGSRPATQTWQQTDHTHTPADHNHKP